MSELIARPGAERKLMVIGATFDPIEVTPHQLIFWKSNDSRLGLPERRPIPRTRSIRELSGVRPMIETYPLEKAAEGYARMMSGTHSYRVVLTM